MSEPTGPTGTTPSTSEGWPTEPPANPNPVTESYPAPAPPEGYIPHPTQPKQQYQPQPQSQYQPQYQPQNPTQYQQVFIEKSPQRLEGEKLATTSTIFGIISIFFAGIIFGPLAIIKASKAEKLGVDSTIGKVTGWVGIAVAALSLVITLFYVLVFGAILASDPGPSSSKLKTGGFSNSQDYGAPQGGMKQLPPQTGIKQLPPQGENQLPVTPKA